MKLFKRPGTVLDERELQELYRIEHAGLWVMYLLLCGVIVVQLLLGAQMRQLVGELTVVSLVGVGMIIAYARRGIWDAHARPSGRDNALYAFVSGVCVSLIVIVHTRRAALGMMAGVLMFALCFILLTILMQICRQRQSALSDEADED